MQIEGDRSCPFLGYWVPHWAIPVPPKNLGLAFWNPDFVLTMWSDKSFLQEKQIQVRIMEIIIMRHTH